MTVQSVKKQSFWKYSRANWVFYAMSIPGLVYIIGYKILPLLGLQLAFKDFNMFLGKGIQDSLYNCYHPMLFITRADVKPLQMYLYELITTTQNLYEVDPVIAAGLSSSGMQAAAIVVSTLPILLVYPFLQKYFIKGLTVGSVKG